VYDNIRGVVAIIRGRPMKTTLEKAETGAFTRAVGRALRRAEKAARKAAVAHHTPSYIWRNGKVAAKKPW
jgi:hypothetical protein